MNETGRVKLYVCMYICLNVCEQAQLLFEEMQNRIFVPIDVMASILPQIVNDDNALKFIETNLNEGGQLQVCIIYLSFMYVCMYVHMYCMYVCMYVCMTLCILYQCMHVCKYIQDLKYMSVYVCMYVHMYVCICVVCNI